MSLDPSRKFSKNLPPKTSVVSVGFFNVMVVLGTTQLDVHTNI